MEIRIRLNKSSTSPWRRTLQFKTEINPLNWVFSDNERLGLSIKPIRPDKNMKRNTDAIHKNTFYYLVVINHIVLVRIRHISLFLNRHDSPLLTDKSVMNYDFNLSTAPYKLRPVKKRERIKLLTSAIISLPRTPEMNPDTAVNW